MGERDTIISTDRLEKDMEKDLISCTMIGTMRVVLSMPMITITTKQITKIGTTVEAWEV